MNTFETTLCKNKENKFFVYEDDCPDEYFEENVTIFYDYSPEEERTWNYPGCRASVEICFVKDSNDQIIPEDKISLDDVKTRFEDSIIGEEISKTEHGDDDYHRFIEEKLVLESRIINNRNF